MGVRERRDARAQICAYAPRKAAEDGVAVARNANGTTSLATALGEWSKSQSAGLYLAAPSQPGFGAPNPSMPWGGQKKALHELDSNEFEQVLQEGVKGRLAGGPIVELKKTFNPMMARRNELLGKMQGGQSGPRPAPGGRRGHQ